ncbi:hypothetical protein WJX81_004564 [Elliptochloris bilobata]|uniref:Sulfate transporter n=1 Tax=Elliptochloris bilobata TaxID=381761 RepID=A0AAW1SJY7_9CHLO
MPIRRFERSSSGYFGANSLQLRGNSLQFGKSPLVRTLSHHERLGAPVLGSGTPPEHDIEEAGTAGESLAAPVHTAAPAASAGLHVAGPRLSLNVPPRAGTSAAHEEAGPGAGGHGGHGGLGNGAGLAPEKEPLLEPSGEKQRPATGIGNEITYGVINAVVGIPEMISFAAIIFKDDLYTPWLGQLSKLAFLGSAMHQLVFTIMSSLPFAVAQVQDVSLIFQSAMATSIAAMCTAAGFKAEEALGTSLLTLVIATFVVGVLIVLVGKFKLASLVQYVPLPCVGGYLGYVGYFCFAAGISLACGIEVGSFTSWAKLADADALMRLAPTMGATALLLAAMKLAPLCTGTRLEALAPLFLPGALVLIPVAFQLVLLAMGVSLQDAADAGWVLQPKPGTPFWEVYRLFNIKDLRFDGIYWKAAAYQTPKIIALFFICAFGSSLDVAAIQGEWPEPLDFNHELQTVGLSNIVTSLTGAGLTGSYIFSQTLFSMRAGVHTKLHGWIIAGVELAVFLVPYSIVQYMPNLFYGSLLCLFGIEISLDWLFHSYHKVARSEFVLLWMTFLSVVYSDLQTGILAGMLYSVIFFAYRYSQVTVKASAIVPARSAVLRGPMERAVLDTMTARLAAVSLAGYIFFGSSVNIADQVMAVARALVSSDEDVLEASVPRAPDTAHSGLDGESALWSPEMRDRTKEAFAAAPQFLILDFRMVRGLDATAAQSFGSLRSLLQRLKVELIIVELENATATALLHAHGVIGPGGCRAYEKAEDGVHYCEERFLEVARRFGVLGLPARHVSLEDALTAHAHQVLPEARNLARLAADAHSYFTEEAREAGDAIIKVGDPASSLCYVVEGRACMDATFIRPDVQRAIEFPIQLLTTGLEGIFEYGPGAMLGSSDFFMNCPTRFRVTAAEPCRLLWLSREGLQRMTRQKPEAAAALVSMIMRSSALENQHLFDFLARSNAVLS